MAIGGTERCPLCLEPRQSLMSLCKVFFFFFFITRHFKTRVFSFSKEGKPTMGEVPASPATWEAVSGGWLDPLHRINWPQSNILFLLKKPKHTSLMKKALPPFHYLGSWFIILYVLFIRVFMYVTVCMPWWCVCLCMWLRACHDDVRKSEVNL